MDVVTEATIHLSRVWVRDGRDDANERVSVLLHVRELLREAATVAR